MQRKPVNQFIFRKIWVLNRIIYLATNEFTCATQTATIAISKNLIFQYQARVGAIERMIRDTAEGRAYIGTRSGDEATIVVNSAQREQNRKRYREKRSNKAAVNIFAVDKWNINKLTFAESPLMTKNMVGEVNHF